VGSQLIRTEDELIRPLLLLYSGWNKDSMMHVNRHWHL